MPSEIIQLENEADSLKAAGQFDEAIEKLNAALAIDPNFVRGYLGLAVLYQKVGQFEQSVAHAEKAVELEPGDALNIAALSKMYQMAFEGTRDPIYIEKAEMALARSRGF